MAFARKTAKKRSQRNAFYYFMNDFRKEQNDNKTFINNEELCKAADEKWRNLTDLEKQPYYERAREEKARNRGLTSLGEPIDDVSKLEEQLLNSKREMEEEIRSLVFNKFFAGRFADLQFYIGYINYYTVGITNYYLPAEIGLIRFSLRYGADIRDSFNIIVDHDSINIGYRLLAESLSENTHKIPIPPHYGKNIESRKYSPNILKQILRYLKTNLSDDEPYPPIYVETKHQTDVWDSVLRRFCAENDFNMDSLKIYSLSYLFYVLRNAAHHQVAKEDAFISPAIPEGIFEKDSYDYVKGICCDFHSTSEGYPHCSLGKAIKAAFTICDNCNYDLSIPLIPGHHVPKNALMEKFEEKPKLVNGKKDECKGFGKVTEKPKSRSKLEENIWKNPWNDEKEPPIQLSEFPELQPTSTLFPETTGIGNISTANGMTIRNKESKFSKEELPRINRISRNNQSGDQLVPDLELNGDVAHSSNCARSFMGRGRGRILLNKFKK